jgi:lysozyme family protein
MANYKEYVPFVLRWEGGVSNDPADTGGLTNKGITRATFDTLALKVLGKLPTSNNFYALTDQEAGLFVRHFWNKATGNNSIKSQPIAETITGWYWGSGSRGLRNFQKLLNEKFNAGLKVDGAIGPASVAAINAQNESKLFYAAADARADYFRAIVNNNSSQSKFLRGWLNRLNDFKQRWFLHFQKKKIIVAAGLIAAGIILYNSK